MTNMTIVFMTSSIHPAVDSAASGALGIYCVLCGCPARSSTERIYGVSDHPLAPSLDHHAQLFIRAYDSE